MAKKSKAIKVVILDIDGTLIDSNDAHASSWVEALAKHGIAANFEKIRSLIGMGGDRLLPAVTGIEEDSSLGKEVADTRKQLFRDQYLPKLKPFPGTRELLTKLKDRGLRLVVATSSGEDLLNLLLEQAEVDDLIETATSKDDAESSKPAPDIVEAAVERAKVHPDEAIMLGDTPYDVEAATKAGVRIVAFTCGGWATERLVGAEAVYEGPGDLLDHLDDSPLGRKPASGKRSEAQPRL